MSNGIAARKIDSLNIEESSLILSMGLITVKPMLYVCNLSEDNIIDGNAFSKTVSEKAKSENCGYTFVSAQIEQELSLLDEKERNIVDPTVIGRGEDIILRRERGMISRKLSEESEYQLFVNI